MSAPSQFDIDLEDFVQFLQLVRSLSPNTVSAYRSDVEFFFEFLKDPASFKIQLPKLADPRDATPEHLGKFLRIGYDNDITQRSQARRLSAIKAFYKFLDAGCNPCDQVAVPKLARKLPTVLSVDEVLSIIEQVDLTEPEGSRNRAILEMLYSCGLRVSELVNLKLSDLFFNEGFIRIIGKGNKQRLIPIGEYAINAVEDYRPSRWSVLQRAKTIGGSGGKHISGGTSVASSSGTGKLRTSKSAKGAGKGSTKGAGKGSSKGIDEDLLFLN
ncbi:MAG: tyrosine-type recombinase/integrase, partial [Bacteroidales bacterium]|nr:tyrosine-type recombinase/integrase [Bacteroidales bacterium]